MGYKHFHLLPQEYMLAKDITSRVVTRVDPRLCNLPVFYSWSIELPFIPLVQTFGEVMIVREFVLIAHML